MSGDAATGWLSAPTWMVDAARLRDTCDRLRRAMDQTSAFGAMGAGGALVHDHRAIVDSLRHVFARLDAVDLEARQATSAVVREFRSVAQAARLRELFDGLQSALRRHVRDVLGPAKLQVIARLLASPAPDLLRILGREDHENSHSDLIAWLLNPRRAPVVALHALRRLTMRLEDGERWAHLLADAVADDSVSVRREVVIGKELAGNGDLCRIDIVVSGPGFVLGVENKVWAREHPEQTATYWSWLEQWPCLRAGLFLSPSGVAASSSGFLAVSYLHLVDALTEGPARGSITQGEEIVLASYLKTLARGIIPVEMRAVVEASFTKETS